MAVSIEQHEIACQACGAKILFEPLHRTVRCPYCDSPSVIDRPATPDRPDPVFVVGFSVDRNEATSQMRRFISRKKLAPPGLRGKAAERLSGVYLPAYLYSAVASSSYHAKIGEDYYVREVSRDSKGRTSVKRKRKTEYYNLRGPHRSYVGDVVVTASRGIPNAEVEAIEPFDLGGLRRFTPSMVSGWVSEEPSMSREECLQLARRESTTKIRDVVRRFMPGDRCRGVESRTALSEEAIDLVLLPVWVFAIRYRDDKPPIRLLVNGQTGRAWGKIPVSWKKVAIITGVVLGAIAVPVILALIAGLF
jgi:DNA-directed RNA polymerase subunit RPC12/RpoP